MVGAEALVRWQHPTLGALTPAQFLPVAEDAGLAPRLGAWVLARALDQLVVWDGNGRYPGVQMSVNLGAGETFDPGLEAAVLAALAERALTPSRLCLEVTEPLLLGMGSRRRRPAPAAIQALAGRGVVIAIDDFATGFPGLHALRDYPAGVLKIDHTVVVDVATDQTAAGVVAAVVALARTTGKTTVAEGVETAEQAKVLTSIGVDRGQGHYFGRPRPGDD